MAARIVHLGELGAKDALLGVGSAESPLAHALAPYRNVRDRELSRGLDGGPSYFVAEGEVVVRVLATRGRFRVRSMLVEERRVRGLSDVIEALPGDVTVYVAPQDAMNDLVGFAIHRGILAVGERGPRPSATSLLNEPHVALGAGSSLVVGLVGLANHDNVGSVFRNAAAFGIRGVLLDDATCDPLYRKALRVSVGASLVVPFARCASAESMLSDLEQHGYEAIALTPRADERLDDMPWAPRRALLLGTEGPGLPPSVLARARPVRIDMAPTLDSLNVAVASGIALYEASRMRDAAGG